MHQMTEASLHSEIDWINRLKEDDLQAFDALYWKYQKAVFQNAFKLTREEALAEDIVQEVFINLWEKRHSIDSSRGVGGWLFVSSYNRAVNLLRKKLKEWEAIRNMSEAEESVDASVFDVQYGILLKAMDTLSPQKRKVFELCKLQGLTYEQAAAQLNISKHTVKEYLGAAISSIKEYAQQHGANLAVLLFLKTMYA